MLILCSLVVTVVINLTYCTAAISVQELPIDAKNMQEGRKVLNALTTLTKSNRTERLSFERDHKAFLLPTMATRLRMPKRRNMKKSPKSTIQKIIRKAKRPRRTYLNQMTSVPTETLPEEKQPTVSTTMATHSQKKKQKKPKYARFPLPFQKLPGKKEASTYHRTRRDLDRDIFILQDLDEVQFLSNEDGTNAIKAHVKNYW